MPKKTRSKTAKLDIEPRFLQKLFEVFSDQTVLTLAANAQFIDWDKLSCIGSSGFKDLSEWCHVIADTDSEEMGNYQAGFVFFIMALLESTGKEEGTNGALEQENDPVKLLTSDEALGAMTETFAVIDYYVQMFFTLKEEELNELCTSRPDVKTIASHLCYFSLVKVMTLELDYVEARKRTKLVTALEGNKSKDNLARFFHEFMGFLPSTLVESDRYNHPMVTFRKRITPLIDTEP